MLQIASAPVSNKIEWCVLQNYVEIFFTTGALDNIDHNPSGTTAKDSFHGTAISLTQHPTDNDRGVDRGVNVIYKNVVQQKRVRDLPAHYTNVHPVVLQTKNAFIPQLIGPVMPPFDVNASSLTKELDWFNNVKSLCGKNELNNKDFMSWAAFHASLQPTG